MRKFRIIQDQSKDNPLEYNDYPATWALFGNKFRLSPNQAEVLRLGDEPIEDLALYFWDQVRPYECQILEDFINNWYIGRPEKSLDRVCTWFEASYIYLPVYMYDHGGQTIRTYPFNCRWDSGQIGYIAISRKQAANEYFGKKRLSKSNAAIALENLKGEVALVDAWLTGDVYGFKLEDGATEDSCFGFYGDPREDIKDHLPEWAQSLVEKAWDNLGEWQTL